ncbi:hypothetical protein GOODEAATRI_000853 [Goodea atripinnis]|uniref:EF-hand domain-containing protein n=1 Tax=Goodea atripinnis TaxID=208336 RepID=A0ABV0N6T8_9TELE
MPEGLPISKRRNSCCEKEAAESACHRYQWKGLAGLFRGEQSTLSRGYRTTHIGSGQPLAAPSVLANILALSLCTSLNLKRRKAGRRAKVYTFLSRMGNTKSSALSKELLEELKSNTKYTEAELCTWYQSFLKECPSGKITKEQFEGIYASFFPGADPTAYARHVFRSFDTNADGTLDFKEYIVALHLTSGGKTLQKLEWAFALYDVDGNGTISKNEIQEIVRVLRPS